MKLKLALIISLVFNWILLSQKREIVQINNELKQKITQNKEVLKLDKIKISASARKKKTKTVNTALSAPKLAARQEKVELDEEAIYYEINNNTDDQAFVERLINESEFTPDEVQVIEETRKEFDKKWQKIWEKNLKDKPYLPHRWALEKDYYRDFSKDHHKALMKKLGLEKYESYMSLLDQYNKEVSERMKNGEREFHYRSL